MSEAQLSNAVRELALLLGWRGYHTFDSRRSDPGFPDWVFVRDRVLYAELKAVRGVLSPGQVAWRDALVGAGAEWHLWDPSHWRDGTIEAALR